MTLAEQLACVEQWLRQYPRRWFEKGEAAERQADHDLACMRAVAETLRGLMKGEGS